MVLRPVIPGASALSVERFAAHSAQGRDYRIGTPPPSARWLAYWLQDNFLNSYENLRRGRLYVQSAKTKILANLPMFYPATKET
jgi:hypothetical protein